MQTIITFFLVAVAAYLLGSFPSGYVFARLWGCDIRQRGSGRTGGTNVMRTLGPCPAILTIIADTSKGLLAVGLGGFLIGTPAAQVLAGLAVIIGHNYPLFLRGGGRGVATSLAALAALSLYPAAIVWIVLLAVLLASHYASLASLAGAVFMPLTLLAWIVLGHHTVWYLLYGLGACALIILAHRDNIGRLWLGTERKVSEKAKTSQAAI